MSKIDKIVDGVKDAVLEGLKGAQKIIDNYEFNGNNITININEKLVSKEIASQLNDAIGQVENQLKRTDIDLSNIYFDNKKANAKNIMNDYVRDLLAIDVSKGQVDEEINSITRNIEYTSQQLKQTLDDYSVELFESANRYSSVIDKINSERMKSNIRYNGDSSKYTKELNILENYNEQEFIDFYNLFDDYRNGMKEFSDLYRFRPSKDNKDKFLDFARNLSYTDMRYSENKDLNTYTTLLEQGVLGDTKDFSDVSIYLDSIIRKLNEISEIKINFNDIFQTEAFADFNLAIQGIASGLSSLNNDFRKVNNLDIIDAQAQKVAGAKDKLLYTKSGKINEGKVNKKNIQNYIKEYDKYLQMSNKEAFFEDNQNSQILKKYYDEFKNQDIKDVEASARKLRETLSEGADFSFFKTLIKSINTLGGNKSAEKINAITENLEKLQTCIKSLDFSNPSFNELNQILANADVLRTAFKTQKTAETKAKKASYPDEYKQFISGQKDFQNIDDEQYDYFKNKFSKEYTSNLSKLDKKIQTSPYSEQIAKFRNQYSDMYNQFSNLDDVEDGLNSMKQMTASWNEFWNSLSSTKSNSKIESIISQMTTFKNGNPKIGKENIAVIDSLIDSLRSLKGELGNGNEYNEIVEKFFSLKSAMTDQGKTGDSFFGKMGSEWVRGTTQLLKNYFGIMDIIRYGREAIQVVTELDTALTELRKVSDASTSELATMFQRASTTAQELGSTVSDVINAQADWSRMGYNLDESDELARVSTIYKNVGDGISQEEANESLISTLQGFRMTADESMDIIDKFNEVSNNYAISSGGIGEALQRSAASFTAANTDLSKAIALVTTSNTVVQNPETVGTAFKSMSARLRGATTELEEMGEAEDGVTNTTAKLQSLVKGLTGFDIMEDDKKTFKDIYDIMVGIGEQWDNLTDVEQASLSEALFGKRNSNIGFSVLQNIDTLKSVYKTAEESQGSALKEQERYNESIQAHINQTKASLQELLYTAIDSGLIKDALDMGKDFLDILTEIIDDFGLLKTLIPIVLGALNIKGNNVFGDIVGKVLNGNIKPSDVEVNFSDTMKSFISKAQENPTKSGVEILAMMGGEADGLSNMEKKIAEGAKANTINMDSMTEAMKRSGSAMGTLKNIAGTLLSSLKSLAIGFGIGVAIDLAITALTKLYDWMTITAEEAKDMSEQFNKITSSIYDNQAENTKKVGELNSEFQKLQSGVDNSGNNISLSADQYDRYKEIVGELSNIMPNLSTHFNSQGEAIGFVTGKITDLTNEYQKYIKTQSLVALSEKGEDGHYLYEGVLENYKNGLIEEIDNDSIFTDSAIGDKTNLLKILKNSQTMTQEQLSSVDSLNQLSVAIGKNQSEISAMLKKDGGYNKIQSLISNRREMIETELEANSVQIRNLMETYMKSTNSFWAMEEKQRDNVTSFLSGLDAETLAKLNINNYQDLTEFSSKVLSNFSDVNNSLNTAYQELQTMDKSEMSVDEYKKNIEDYTKQIQESLGIDNEDAALGIVVKITGVDVESIEENKKAIEEKLGSLDIQGDYKKWTDNLSVGDLELVNTENFAKELNRLQELSNDNTISFNELNTALYNVKNSAQDTKTAVESLADVNKKVDSLDSLYDKYEQNGYLEQGDVAKILEENPEYYKYLIKVGEQYKLNERSYDEWVDSVNKQQSLIDAMLGGFGFAKEYQDDLDNIMTINKARTEGSGTGQQQGKTEIDGLVESYRNLNNQMLNGEITSQDYLNGLKEQIVSLDDNFRSANGHLGQTTDYLEQISSIQLSGLGNAMAGISNQYVNGLISTSDYLGAAKTTLETSRSAYGSIHNIEEINNNGKIEYEVNASEIENAEEELSALQKVGNKVKEMFQINSEESNKSSKEMTEDAEKIKEQYEETGRAIQEITAVEGFAKTFEDFHGSLMQFQDEMGNIDFTAMAEADPSGFQSYLDTLYGNWQVFLANTENGQQQLASVLQNTLGIEADTAAQAVSYLANGETDMFNQTLGTMVNISDIASALTIEAKAQTVYAVNNASSAIGNILGTLADAISNFDYSLTATGKITFGLETEEVNNPFAFLPGSSQPAKITIPTGLNANGSLGITGKGGAAINEFASALKGAGNYFASEGAAISARAGSWDSYAPAGTSRMATPAPFRPSYDGGSGGGGGGGSDGGSGGGGGGNDGCSNANGIDEAQEKMDSCTTIDHFETKIKRLEREIENLDKIASHTFIGWQERNNKLGDSFWKLSNELHTQCSGMWMYLDKANSVPLDDFHKNLINNGCTSIETFADDNLKNLIDEYKEWYEKALDCADAIEEIKEKQAEVFSQQFDNVGKQYDQLIERVESANEKLDLWIENQETRGKFVANSYYATQIDNERKRFMNLQEQLKKQQDLMNCSVNQGAVQLFSEQWYEMNNAIMETDNEMQKTMNTIDELNNKMRENNWDIFDKKMEWKEMLEEESNFLIDALSRDELYNENGTFNEGGISVAGMRAVNFDYNMARAQDYKKAIAEVEAEMKKLDYTDQNLVDRRNELLKLQQDSIKAALDEKDAIKDLVKEGYDKLVSYLDKLTDKYKQTLRAQKDLYDYEKSIRKQTEAINDYSKQLMALEGDDSEENKARLQQLRQNLKDAEEELEDTEYNKWLEDQESMLDDMMSDLEEWVEEKLTHTDEIIQEQIDAINDSKDVISETINDKADDLGYSLTEAMDGIINNNCTAYDLASDFHGEFTNEWNRTLDYLKSIDETIDEMRSRTCTESSDNRGCTSMVNNGVANNGCSSADQFQSWVDMKPLNPQNECTSQQNNGCSQPPQNNGCSQPQNNGCTQPQNNGCSQQQNNACTPQNDDCTRNNSCSNYATGRRKGNKELAWTQEKGQEAIYRKSDGALLTPLGNGDKVFTNAQTEALWNMSKGLNPTALPSVAKVNNSVKTGDSNVVFEGDINVVGVTNPREFSEQLRNAINNDDKVKKTLQANTLGVAVGKNSLLGNSIK